MVPSPLADVGEKKWAIFFDTALDAFAAASAKGSRTSEEDDDDDGLVRVGKASECLSAPLAAECCSGTCRSVAFSELTKPM